MSKTPTKSPLSSHGISLDNTWKILLCLILFFYGITQASSVLIPLVFSFFLAILLIPVATFFEKKGINRALASFLTLLLLIIVFGGGLYYIGTQGRNLILDLPDLVGKFNSYLESLADKLASINGTSSKEPLDLIKKNSDQLISSGTSFFGDALTITSSLLEFFTLIPIYVFFILLYRNNFKRFLVKIDGSKDGNLSEIASEIKDMVHNYIVGLSIVISIIAILNTIGLVSLGLEYAVFMGVLSAALTVIPYIGIFIGGALPFLVALITKDSLIYPLGVILIVGFVQFLEGNFITPKIIGSKVNVNPLAAIVALIIGGAVWGIVGMIIAIPITGIIKIIFSHYEKLQPYSILLESDDKEDKRPASKKTSFGNRLKKLFGK